jgi:AraC family transcriptional regulator
MSSPAEPFKAQKVWTGPVGIDVHAVMPPHTLGNFTSVTQPKTIGVSFTGHRRAVARLGQDALTQLEICPGATFVSWSGATQWLRVEEPSEALEILLDPDVLASAAESLDAGAEPFVVDATAVDDLMVWSICSQLRAALLSSQPPDALEMDQWLHLLAEHSLVTYGGLRFPKRGTGRLGPKRLARVSAFIDAQLDRPIRLTELAELASLSVFHFARSFRNSTGLPPHRFVAARRMQRARDMLAVSRMSIEDVAASVGYLSLPHFRACFRAHFGVSPSCLRRPRRN